MQSVIGLSNEIIDSYSKLKPEILKRLGEFKRIPDSKLFYELAFCICTPQSKAANALIVQNMLESINYINYPADISTLLRNPGNYIRFHNTKAKRIYLALLAFEDVRNLLNSGLSNFDKRDAIAGMVKGIGMKEASHFLRNIGFEGLAILDRHILKHLVLCGLYKDIPKISTKNKYREVETEFIKFSEYIGIPSDHLDLLFWSYETGVIIK